MTTQIFNGVGDELKNRVMKKIYFIWFFKKIAPILFLEMPFLFFIVFHEAARQFFVSNILHNFINATFGSREPFWSVMDLAHSAFASALYNDGIAPFAVIGISGIFIAALAVTLARKLKLILYKSSDLVLDYSVSTE